MKQLVRSKATPLTMLALLAILTLSMALANGCATLSGGQKEDFVSISFKTLATAKITYIASMSALGDLYKQGQLSEAQKVAAVLAGKQFVKWYDVAAKALLTYQQVQTSAAKAQATASLDNFGKWYTDFLQIVEPMLKLGTDLAKPNVTRIDPSMLPDSPWPNWKIEAKDVANMTTEAWIGTGE